VWRFQLRAKTTKAMTERIGEAFGRCWRIKNRMTEEAGTRGVVRPISKSVVETPGFEPGSPCAEAR